MLINVYFNSYELETLGDFLDNQRISPAFSYKEKPKEFLDIKDERGVSNYEKIRLSYNGNQVLLEEIFSKYSKGDYNSIDLISPTTFVIESTQVAIDLFAAQGNLVQPTIDVNYFISTKLANLLKNPGYITKRNQTLIGNSSGSFPKVTVWLWSRTLNTGDDKFGLLNLSPFVNYLNTNSVKEGGHFGFSLAPVLGAWLRNNWRIKKESYLEFKDDNEGFTATVNAQRLKTLDYPVEDGEGRLLNKEIVEENFFFDRVIGSNDLIFISFQEFEIEEKQKGLQIPYSALKGKIWDMMGLVDEVSSKVSVNERSTEVSIQVEGRDFTKTIIEDGCYFFATEFGLDGTFRFAGNRDDKILRRLGVGEQGMANYFTISTKSIEYALKFIISQIANTGFVPGDIFDSYDDSRSTLFEVIDRQNVEVSEEIADGIWAITKILVDPSISNLRLVNNSLFTEQGSLINYIQTLCQEPFVEFYTETIGDQFYWIARRPPWNLEGIRNSINGVSYVDFAKPSISEKVEAYEMGASALNNPVVRTTKSFVIDIMSEDVYERQLDFEELIYTWYKLESRFVLGGGQNEEVSSLSLLPAVFLPSYTKIWGSRPLQLTSSYIQYVPTNSTEEQKRKNNALVQATYDLKWMIDTNAYLPFTRKGSITIKEDRRIKKGMHVRFRPTGEIFLVDSVNHNVSVNERNINRKTQLGVTRGMVEDFIEGVEIDGKTYGYFNLVNTDINESEFYERNREQSADGTEFENSSVVANSLISGWREDEDVINFFLQRKQFIEQ